MARNASSPLCAAAVITEKQFAIADLSPDKEMILPSPAKIYDPHKFFWMLSLGFRFSFFRSVIRYFLRVTLFVWCQLAEALIDRKSAAA